MCRKVGDPPEWLTIPIQPYIHLLHPLLPPTSHPFIHPSPLYTPLPDYHRRKKQLDFILCSCSIMARLISGPCLSVRHCVVAMTPPHKENQLNFSRMFKKTSLTFFFFLRLTFTPSTDTTMLTFFFLMFFTLNSYCREKTGKHMLINVLVINVWIKNKDE